MKKDKENTMTFYNIFVQMKQNIEFTNCILLHIKYEKPFQFTYILNLHICLEFSMA